MSQSWPYEALWPVGALKQLPRLFITLAPVLLMYTCQQALPSAQGADIPLQYAHLKGISCLLGCGPAPLQVYTVHGNHHQQQQTATMRVAPLRLFKRFQRTSASYSRTPCCPYTLDTKLPCPPGTSDPLTSLTSCSPGLLPSVLDFACKLHRDKAARGCDKGGNSLGRCPFHEWPFKHVLQDVQSGFTVTKP
jgi:hypothetical protein